MLELPGYELELPREDAVGRWTMDVEMLRGLEWKRGQLLQTITGYVGDQRNKEMPLTGIMFGEEGDDQARTPVSITFARDPHQDPAIATPSPYAYTKSIKHFVDLNVLKTPLPPPRPDFRVVLGLRSGHSSGKTFSVSYAKELLSSESEVALRPGYMFGRWYRDKNRNFQEPAVEISGQQRGSLMAVAHAAKALERRRFIVETAAHTTVYNLITA